MCGCLSAKPMKIKYGYICYPSIFFRFWLFDILPLKHINLVVGISISWSIWFSGWSHLVTFAHFHLEVRENINGDKQICLSAQSIVHLTAQIQIMETRVANFFWGCTGPHFGPTNTINTKNYQKNTCGPIYRKPPKMHCNAPQCTAM